MITIHCNNNKDKLREAKQLPKKKKKYTHTDNKKNEKLDRKKNRYLNRKKASNITSLLKIAVIQKSSPPRTAYTEKKRKKLDSAK